MKLLGSTEKMISKNKNGEKVPHLETTEVVLVHCNIVNNDYQHESCIHLFPTNCLDNSSVKSSVLAHLKSQPRGKSFQAQM